MNRCKNLLVSWEQAWELFKATPEYKQTASDKLSDLYLKFIKDRYILSENVDTSYKLKDAEQKWAFVNEHKEILAELSKIVYPEKGWLRPEAKELINKARLSLGYSCRTADRDIFVFLKRALIK